MKNLSIFIFVSIFSTFLTANYSVPVDKILEHGVNYARLNPAAVSDDISYFIATERIYDVKKIAAGNAFDLLIFRFEDESLASVDRIELKIYHLVNVAYDHIKHRAYVVGDHGNKIIRVNTLTGAQKTVFKYKRGMRGFKAGPFVFCHNSKLYATGWFFNEKQEWLGDYVARIRFGKRGVSFKRKASLDYLYKFKFAHRGRVRTNFYVSGDLFFFSLIDQLDKQTHLLEFRDKKVNLVDKGHLISTFAGTEDRIFYAVKNKDKTFSHYVKNLKTGKKYSIGRKHNRFTYPFIKEDKLIVFEIDLKFKTFDAYIGLEKNSYFLKRFIKNETLGAMKVSSDAKRFLFMGVKGFQIGSVPE